MGNHIPFTYPAILLAVFARQMCLPVPTVLFLIMAGALGASGRLSPPLIILIGVLGCLAADLLWFQAGRRWGSRILRILCAFTTDRSYCAQRAREVFARWGLRTLLIAKFLPGLDGLMPPLSGMEGVGVFEFLLFDGLGALLWSSAYCLAGYFFAGRIDVVTSALYRVSGALVTIFIVPVMCYLLWRTWEFAQMVRRLRIATISPAALRDKLQSGRKVAVLDLLFCEEESLQQPGPGIPGAIRVHPARLRKAPRVNVPEDVEVVLYCSSPNGLTSARVAVSLRHKGVKNIGVLEGGLNGWQRQNFPVTTELADPEEVRLRFGITLAH